MIWLTRALVRLVIVLAIAVGGIVAWGWHASLAPSDPPARSTLQAAAIRKGAALAAVGNCNVCHTTSSGASYAGGRAIETPFGKVIATNITPDRDTGIGRYSPAAFTRAMREGVDREGRHLYPAFPYDHLAKVNDDDLSALYAFVMTREPVKNTVSASDLKFPYNLRMLLSVWKLAFHDRTPIAVDAGKSAEWNCGRYLVEGLAHCGACHTPRNAFGAERSGAAYAGGQADGWSAPALDASSPAAVPWTAERLAVYLRTGHESVGGVAAGPMAAVAHNLRDVPDTDIKAMAVYVAALAGAPSRERQEQSAKLVARGKGEGATRAAAPAATAGPGAQIYAGACAGCHGEAGRAPRSPALNLALSSPVRAGDPANAVRIILDGLQPPEASPGPHMPGFRDMLTEAQVAQLASYLRSNFTDRPAWAGIEDAVRRASTR